MLRLERCVEGECTHILGSAMERTDLKRTVDRLEALPTLCAVAVQLLQLTNDESSRASSIARVIESDQTLTARLLRLVNSSSYNFDSEITTVARAVVALGFNTIRCMALGMAVTDMFPTTNGGGAFDLRKFWTHSLACAVGAEMLAERSGAGLDKDEAFVAGLLHDIGKLVLKTSLKGEYDGVVQRARDEDRSLLEVEQEVLGANHSEVGKWLAERWKLPDMFAQVIWLHHQAPGAIDGDHFNRAIISTVHLSDALARTEMIGSSGNDQYTSLDAGDFAVLSISNERVQDIRSQLRRRVEERASVVDLDLDEASLYLESLQRANMELSRMSAKAEEQNRVLARRAQRFRALHKMNGQLAPGQTLNDVVDILAQSLRDGFEVKTGLCYVANGRTKSLKGKAWKEGGPLRDVEISIESPRADGLDATCETVLRDIALQFRDEAWLGQALVDILRRQDFLVVPMIAERRSLGQFLIDLRSGDPKFGGESALDEILAFASEAGMAVSRVYVNYALKHRSEELATAMWKKEQAHKQLLHSERLAAVGKMAAGAAHEINNPLAIISGRAQMMLQKEHTPADKKALELIVDQCSRASKILTDLMGFARPALPKKGVMHINAVVHETLGMFERRFDKHGIKLEADFTQGLPKVLVDKNQLQQVFVNLLLNAEHAITPPGSVRVSTSINKTNDRIVIAFTDTGCGIAPEHQQSIFEPFFTTKKEGEGTGLGLSLAYGIVESHQGTISVKSRLGEGSTFTITLPVAKDVDTVQDRGGAPAAEAPRGQRAKRVLVVDDEVQVRAVIAEALVEAGYDVEQVENGIDALESLQRSHFDLMTLDIRMPRMDGMSVLRAVAERLPDLPVIVVTGLASREEMAAAENLGVRACIRKPFDVARLLDEVQKALAVT